MNLSWRKNLSETDRWKRRFEEAVRHHGDECVGLAIGVRAVDIVFRELHVANDTPSGLSVKLGTKKCLGDAFEALLGLESGKVEYVEPRTGVILARKGEDAIELHLTQTKIRDVANVFEWSEQDLFPIIRRLKINQR